MAGNFDRKLRLPRIHFRVLLYAANMRHGTNGFTSLPKEDVLRNFTPQKILRLTPALNPRTWVPKASTLPLDHRIRLNRFGCPCVHHAIVYDSRGTSPLILNLKLDGRQSPSRPGGFSLENRERYPLNRRLCGPRSRSVKSEERNNCLSIMIRTPELLAPYI